MAAPQNVTQEEIEEWKAQMYRVHETVDHHISCAIRAGRHLVFCSSFCVRGDRHLLYISGSKNLVLFFVVQWSKFFCACACVQGTKHLVLSKFVLSKFVLIKFVLIVPKLFCRRFCIQESKQTQAVQQAVPAASCTRASPARASLARSQVDFDPEQEGEVQFASYAGTCIFTVRDRHIYAAMALDNGYDVGFKLQATCGGIPIALFLGHKSVQPNLMVQTNNAIVALRDIAAGERLVLDLNEDEEQAENETSSST